MKKKQVFCVINFKGGVGKSSLSSLMSAKMDRRGHKSAVFNIALTQPAEGNNPSATIDFGELLGGDSTLDVKEVLSDVKEMFELVFVDTPGELSDELVAIINEIDVFIFPFESTKLFDVENKPRGIKDTLACIESIFSSGIYNRPVADIIMVCNKYYSDHDVEKQIEYFKDMIGKMELLNSVNFNGTSLSFSKAMETIDVLKEDIDSLSAKNAVAYRALNRKIDLLVDDVVKFSEI